MLFAVWSYAFGPTLPGGVHKVTMGTRAFHKHKHKHKHNEHTHTRNTEGNYLHSHFTPPLTISIVSVIRHSRIVLQYLLWGAGHT